MFDIGIGEFIVLAVLALFVFGPEKLPKLIADVTRTLRELRKMAQGAQRELTESLDPGLKGIDLQSLDPRTFVKRNFLDDLDLDLDAATDRERLQGEAAAARGSNGRQASRRTSRTATSRPVLPVDDDSTATSGDQVTAATNDAENASTSSAPNGQAAPVREQAPIRQPAPWDDDIT